MISVSPPKPVPTEHSRPFWEGCRQRELRIPRCPACRSFSFPPLPSCGACGSLETEWVQVSGRGTVYSFTVARHAVHPAFPAPYVIALVELEGAGGTRLTTRLVGCAPEEVHVGAPVEVVFEELDEEITLPLFRLG